MAKPYTDLRKQIPDILEKIKKKSWLYKSGYAKKLGMENLTETYFSESAGAGLRQNSKKQIMIFWLLCS